MLKRKWRYAFEGKDDAGNIAFPFSFIKSNRRPQFPYMLVADENGGKEVMLPGEIFITQYFTMFDKPHEAIEAYNKIKWQDVTSGTLFLTDGCGNTLEEWQFKGVKVVPYNDDVDEGSDDFIIEWKVSYEESTWKCHDALTEGLYFGTLDSVMGQFHDPESNEH